jgi:signal peptidase II
VNPGARRGARILFGTAAGVLVLDRGTKVWAERALADHPIEVIPGVFTLRFTSNSGGAFSLGQSAPWFFAAATIVVSALIVVTAFRARGVIASVALGLILGGALGNLADRAIRGPGLRGHVVDFIDLHVWPVFNVADSAVVIGALLLAWSSFRDDRADRRSGDAVEDGA